MVDPLCFPVAQMPSRVSAAFCSNLKKKVRSGLLRLLQVGAIGRARGVRAYAWLALVLLAAWCGVSSAQVTQAPNWTPQFPATSPSLRNFSAMAYDASTNQLVLFGGISNSSALNDTWTWNGTTWTQQSPAASPPARQGAMMAYNSSSGQLVLFGGVSSNNSALNDTWTWNGTTWTQQTPATSPPARRSGVMAYDAGTNQVVLFGGGSSSDLLNDTWTWNGTTWTQQTPATSPSARNNATLAYDTATSQLVLFGGAVSSGNVGDTWTWNGTTWTQQSPATSPPARRSGAMAYDAGTSEVVLYGGEASGDLLNDTWTWNGTTWTQLNTVTSSPAGDGYAMAYDTAANQLVLFGFGNHTWTLQQGAANLGSANVCTTGATTPSPCSQRTTLAFHVGAGTTIGSINILTQGGTDLDFIASSPEVSPTVCTAKTYTSAAGCTVDVTFAPTRPGMRYGAVVIEDGAGNVLATGHLFGMGQGPLVAFPSGVQTTIGSGFDQPFGIAVAANGNVFIADTEHNAVKEIVAGSNGNPTGVVSSSSVVTTVGNGFSGLFGVAVDGGGNVFVADSLNDAVKEIVAGSNGNPPGVVSSTSVVTTVGSGFSGPKSVVVDGSGNVFVADSNNNAVKEIVAGSNGNPPGAVSSTSTVNIIASGFNGPTGVAVDGSGNVFVADSLLGTVKEIVAGSNGNPPGVVSSTSTMNVIGSGFSEPATVAVDGSGNVFVADFSNNDVYEIVAGSNGNPPGVVSSTSTVNIIASGFSNPRTVALDGSGNLFISDPGTNAAYEISFSSPPSLNFAQTVVGNISTDSPQTVTLENIGNMALSFPVPTMGNNPNISASFTLDSDSSGTCPLVGSGGSAGTLAAQTSCTLPISFAPTMVGAISGSLILSDTNLNANPGVTQTIALTGTGLAATTTTTLISSLNPSVFTQSVAFTATVAPTTGTALPTGTVQFTVDGVAAGTPVTLNGSGAASFTSSTLAVGTHTVAAVYTSNSSSFTGSSATQLSQVVNKITSTPTVTVGPTTPTVGQPVTVSVTVPTTGTIPPTGMVTIYDNGQPIGTGTLGPNGTVTVTIPGGLPAGTDTITVGYSGNADYGSSTSAPTPVTVNKPVATIAVTANPGTSVSGQMVMLTATVSAATGVSTPTGTVTFTQGATVVGTGTLSGGVATVTTSALPAGTDTITATYNGDTNYTAGTSSTATVTVTMAQAVSTPAFTINPTAPVVGQPVTVSVTVPTTGTAPPTGTVTIYDNGQPIGTGTLGPNGTVTVTIPGGLPAGTDTITVGYSGNSGYASSTSPSQTVTLSAPAALDFTLTLTSAGSQTVIPGNAAPYAVQVAPTSSTYPGVVTFTATGLPSGATVTFTPATVAANGGTTAVNLSVQTASIVAMSKLERNAGSLALGLLLLPLAGARRMRKQGRAAGRYLFLLLVLLAGAAVTTGLTGCGSRNGFFGQAPQTYNITVTATSGTIQHSVNATLNVQ